MTGSVESVINSIMQQYPEDEWLDRCREALPDLSDGDILSSIEIFSGGDAVEVEG